MNSDRTNVAKISRIDAASTDPAVEENPAVEEKVSTQRKFSVPRRAGRHNKFENPEAFSTALSAFELLDSGSAQKSFIITSTQPLEGKSTITANLGFAAALAGKRVLLIDGDMRRPSLHSILGASNDVGLADVLSGRSDATSVMQGVEPPAPYAGIDELTLIASGLADADFLASLSRSAMKTLVQSVERDFDLVLMDTPPALAVNDAAIFATAFDGIILVVKAGAVTERHAKLAKSRLEQSGTPILGAVLNSFDSLLHGLGSHPYDSYY